MTADRVSKRPSNVVDILILFFVFVFVLFCFVLFCFVLFWLLLLLLLLLKQVIVNKKRFDAVSTSNLEVYKFRDWWIFTYFIFGHDESSPNNIWSMVNLERTCVLLFYYFLYFKVILDLEKKTNQLGESSPNFFFCGCESWPNFGNEVNKWWILT